MQSSPLTKIDTPPYVQILRKFKSRRKIMRTQLP